MRKHGIVHRYKENRGDADNITAMISDFSRQFLIAIMISGGALTFLLLGRILREDRPQQKFIFFLFLMLYSSLLLSLFVKTASRPLCWFNLGLLAVGSVYFYAELIAGILRKGSTPTALQEFRRQKGPYYEVQMACHLISEAKLGALMILERKKPLHAWAAKGISVDARVSRELLVSLFTPPGALHDGAVIIRKDKILSAGVIVPLSKNPNLSKELGTRHRAAIGFSEVTDALCLIISEETGAISLADRGKLFYDIPFDKLGHVLERAFRFKMDKARSFALYTEPVKAGA